VVGDWSRASALARTAFSVTGVLPLGAFVIVHVVAWSLASRRPELAESSGSGAMLLAASLALVWLPLAYHAGYGIACWLGVVPRPDAPAGARQLCQLTGPLALVFVLVHGLEFGVPLWTGTLSPRDLHGRLCDTLASTSDAGIPFRAALYLAGVALTVAHFAAGTHSLCLRWAWLRPRLSETGLRRLCAGLGVLLFATAAHAILYFATGGIGAANWLPGAY
jgi:hypothetical protein